MDRYRVIWDQKGGYHSWWKYAVQQKRWWGWSTLAHMPALDHAKQYIQNRINNPADGTVLYDITALK